MVGGGVFSLLYDLVVGVNSGVIIIGWCIIVMGMILFVFVY